MTACLQATTRLEVESLVTDPYVRHPSLTAVALATMDELSNGRAIMGIGGGLEPPAVLGAARPPPPPAGAAYHETPGRQWAGREAPLAGQSKCGHRARMPLPAPR